MRTNIKFGGKAGQGAPRGHLKLSEKADPKGRESHEQASPGEALGIHTNGLPSCKSDYSSNPRHPRPKVPPRYPNQQRSADRRRDMR